MYTKERATSKGTKVTLFPMLIPISIDRKYVKPKIREKLIHKIDSIISSNICAIFKMAQSMRGIKCDPDKESPLNLLDIYFMGLNLSETIRVEMDNELTIGLFNRLRTFQILHTIFISCMFAIKIEWKKSILM